MDFNVVDYQELATSLYTDLLKNDVAYDAVIRMITTVIQDQQGFYGEYYNSFLNIDNSIGKQLDIIGAIVGQPRTLINFITDPFFGFEDAPNAQSFGTLSDSGVGGYWRSITNPTSGSNKKLEDEIYRKIIKARIIKNNSRGTLNDLLRVMNLLTNNTLTSVTDSANSGTATVAVVAPINPLVAYFFQRRNLSDSLIPKPLGVKLSLESVSLPVPSYMLSSSAPSVESGGSITITLTTTNVTDGSLVPYTITGIADGDINIPLIGEFLVIDGTSELTFTVDAEFESTQNLILTLDGIEPPVYVSVDVSPLTMFDYGLRSNFTEDLTDQAGKTWTAHGDASVSGGALHLTSAGDYLDTPYNADFHFGSGQDVTIRFKANISSFGSDLKVLLSTRQDAGEPRNWSLYATPEGIRFLVWSVGTTLVNETWSSVYTFGTEFELSLERKDMTWRLYINGDRVVSSIYTQLADYAVNTTSQLTLGSEINAGGGTGRDLVGSMRYVQIIKGIALGNGGDTTPVI